MAVAVFKSPLSGEYHRSKRMEGKQPAGRRRVFVQTETGCVLGMDLDRGDNAHTVKRRLQLAFNVPTEESSLTFGDMVLKNDLSLKRTVRVGETGFREKEQVSKIASFQQFIPHDFDASDHGTSSFPVAAVHRIGILDIRILNTDRHAGNLLVRKLNDKDELEYIKNLDSIRDSEMLRMELPMIREACLRVLVLCTIFLKEAAAFGLCLAEIGEMMSREFRGGEEEPSELEFVCLEARRLIAEREVLSPKAEGGEEVFQFDMDCEEDRFYFTPKMGADAFMNRGPLHFGIGEVSTISKLSMSLKDTSLGEKSQKYLEAKPESSYLANTSSGHRSANEQLPTSMSFVKLADMNEEEWVLFLEKFQELLYPAFAKRKSVTLGQRQRQRLGTSCQF
ncbi:unnamed protein product, partial [Vitis vinifera]